MVINLILLAIFLGSIFAVWYKISQRIPKLAMVSEEAIASYLKEESTKLHFWVVEIRSFYKEGRYKEWLRNVWAKFLYRLHIVLLKLDNKVTTVLKNLRTLEKPAEKAENINTIQAIAEKVEEKNVSQKITRVQEVRVRKKRSKLKDIERLPE